MPSAAGGDKRWFAFLRVNITLFHSTGQMLIKTTETRRGQFSVPVTIGCRWKWVNCGYLLGPETRNKEKLGLKLNNLGFGLGSIESNTTRDYGYWGRLTFRMWNVNCGDTTFCFECTWNEFVTSTLSKATFSQKPHVELPRGQLQSTESNWTTGKQAPKSLWQFSKGKHFER